MRPGNKLASLTKLWDNVRVLVIEEVSMVAAASYNMLDVRSMHGRSKTHDVSEATYKQPGHHFGRVPIVIQLGDFLQLKPTGSGRFLLSDLRALEDAAGDHAPPAEHQRAMRFFCDTP